MHDVLLFKCFTAPVWYFITAFSPASNAYTVHFRTMDRDTTACHRCLPKGVKHVCEILHTFLCVMQTLLWSIASESMKEGKMYIQMNSRSVCLHPQPNENVQIQIPNKYETQFQSARELKKNLHRNSYSYFFLLQI